MHGEPGAIAGAVGEECAPGGGLAAWRDDRCARKADSSRCRTTLRPGLPAGPLHGHKQVINVLGGTAAWRNAGYPIAGHLSAGDG